MWQIQKMKWKFNLYILHTAQSKHIWTVKCFSLFWPYSSILILKWNEMKTVKCWHYMNSVNASDTRVEYKIGYNFYTAPMDYTSCPHTPGVLPYRLPLCGGSLSLCMWDKPLSSPIRNERCSHHMFPQGTDCNTQRDFVTSPPHHSIDKAYMCCW